MLPLLAAWRKAGNRNGLVHKVLLYRVLTLPLSLLSLSSVSCVPILRHSGSSIFRRIIIIHLAICCLPVVRPTPFDPQCSLAFLFADDTTITSP